MTPTTNSVEPTTSATDRLRTLLDERGVEWMPIAWNPKRETFYHTSNGVGFCADEYADGVKIYTDATITPEQAVAATLGRGECHDEGDPSDFLCSECGARMYIDTGETYTMVDSLENIIEQPNFCPNCGRRIKED